MSFGAFSDLGTFAWKHRAKIAGAARMGWKAYQFYKSLPRASTTRRSSALAQRPRARASGQSGGGAGAMLAGSHFRIRRRRVPRRQRYRRKVRRARFKRFAKKVRKAVGRRGKPPKWHIFRSTAVLSPGGSITTTGQGIMDIAHGHSTHYDGLVALGAVAQNNVQKVEGTPDTYSPMFADRFLNVYKSYMVLYMTNNSSTHVYGKMAICKPRKHINSPNMHPGLIADHDINGMNGAITNEYLSSQSLANLGVDTNYNAYNDMTELVGGTSLNDLGWVWHNSPSFKRFYKAKIRTCDWAPMECKKFIFKMKRKINLDTATDYTMMPATSTGIPTPFIVNPVTTWYVNAVSSGFSEMHQRRGFFVSFLVHGIPARDEAGTTIGLTAPAFDMYWLNAYKYGWSSPGRREYHVNVPNPLGEVEPQVAIPGFGTPAGPIQTG